ncbi:MAG: RidA family protein [Ignavibacteria bacterium]|nr:RidA family protein [Ignavibacteria bacterium]
MSKGVVHHINPEGLHKNPAFTHVISMSGPVKTIFVGGQNSVDSAGTIMGKGDIKLQAEQVMTNLQTALAAVGAGLGHVVKWNVHVVQGQPLQPGLAVFQRVWGARPNPPAITVTYVSGLAHPDFLMEIEAIAVLPE